MATFKRPKDPLKYLRAATVHGALKYFTRRGNGYINRCSFCPYTPPDWLTANGARWRNIAMHMAVSHRAKDAEIYKVGASHGVERSQERKAA